MAFNSPLSSTSTYGAVKIGSGITVTNGVISTTTSTASAYGFFYSTSTQVNTVANSINTATFEVVGGASGVTITNNRQITPASSGTYSVIFSAQLATTGGTAPGFNFWLANKGTDITASNQIADLTNTVSALILTSNYTLTLAVGDYIEIRWSATNTNGELLATAAGTTPIRPSTPSTRITFVKQA